MFRIEYRRIKAEAWRGPLPSSRTETTVARDRVVEMRSEQILDIA